MNFGSEDFKSWHAWNSKNYNVDEIFKEFVHSKTKETINALDVWFVFMNNVIVYTYKICSDKHHSTLFEVIVALYLTSYLKPSLSDRKV